MPLERAMIFLLAHATETKNSLFLERERERERAIQAFVFLIIISSTILHQEGPYGDSAVGVAERTPVLSSK